MTCVPIGSLPAEILRQIFKDTVNGPEDTRSILYLSHVNQFWRSIVHNIGSLHTHADYRIWPTWLIEAWSSRAQRGNHPITVKIDTRALRRLDQSPEFYHFVTSTKHMWGALDVDYVSIRDNEMGYRMYLLYSPLPRLRRLRFAGSGHEIDVNALNLPVLEELEASEISVRFSQAIPTLRSASLQPNGADAWADWALPLEQSPYLTSLLLEDVIRDNLRGQSSKLILATLEDLQLVNMHLKTVVLLISSMEIPNLETLTLDRLWNPRDVPPTHLPSLIRLDIKNADGHTAACLLASLHAVSLRSVSSTWLYWKADLNFWTKLVS